MIIKKIQIENFLCYYGLNTFQFEDGLNIILGENNEGKTKFYEAVDWLFNGINNDLENLVSAKKLKEIALEDSFKVSSSMTVEQYNNEYKISRSFTVHKSNNNEIEIEMDNIFYISFIHSFSHALFIKYYHTYFLLLV